METDDPSKDTLDVFSIGLEPSPRLGPKQNKVNLLCFPLFCMSFMLQFLKNS